jgi:hypothetical protein
MPAMTDELERVGQRYSMLRDEIRREDSIGLTDLYNRFHDPRDTSERMKDFRELHHEMDLAVLRAYGWTDVDIALDFREVGYLPANDRVRLTVSEAARAELLKRLTELNLERHARDAASGAKSSSLRRRAKATPVGQSALALVDAPSVEPKSNTRRTRR